MFLHKEIFGRTVHKGSGFQMLFKAMVEIDFVGWGARDRPHAMPCHNTERNTIDGL